MSGKFTADQFIERGIMAPFQAAWKSLFGPASTPLEALRQTLRTAIDRDDVCGFLRVIENEIVTSTDSAEARERVSDAMDVAFEYGVKAARKPAAVTRVMIAITGNAVTADLLKPSWVNRMAVELPGLPMRESAWAYTEMQRMIDKFPPEARTDFRHAFYSGLTTGRMNILRSPLNQPHL